MLANEASAVCGIDLYTGEHANENRVTGQVTFLTACSVVPVIIFSVFFFFFWLLLLNCLTLFGAIFVCSDILYVCMMMMLYSIYKAQISGGKNYMGFLTNVKDKAGVIL